MKKYVFFLLLAFIVTLGCRIYFVSQKEGWHVDEASSVAFANYNRRGDYKSGQLYFGKQAKEMVMCDNASFRNVLGDIRYLWLDNRDPPHTNFYYSLLRISFAGLKTGDINRITLRGSILNLLLFSLSFFFFFALLKLLFKNNAVAIAGAFCAFMSTGTISNTLFLRPYQLQETLFIIFVYTLFKLIDCKQSLKIKNLAFINRNYFILMSLVTALTLLATYYSVIFVCLFGLYLIYYYLKQKKYDEIGYYVFVLLTSLCLAQVFYTRYFYGIFSSRAKETIGTVADNFMKNTLDSVITAFKIMKTHYFIIPVLFFIIFVSLFLLITSRKQKMPVKFKQYEKSLIVFAISVLYTFMVIILAPYKSLRYFMSVLPFFTMLPITLIMPLKNKRYFLLFPVLMCVSFSMMFFNTSKVEYLYKGKSETYSFTQTPNIPVFLFNRSNPKYGEIAPHFADNQIYIFNKEMDESRFEKYDIPEFYVIYEKTNSELFKPDFDPDSFLVSSVFDRGYFIGLKIQRKST
jgi:hypothetical protein